MTDGRHLSGHLMIMRNTSLPSLETPMFWKMRAFARRTLPRCSPDGELTCALESRLNWHSVNSSNAVNVSLPA